MRRSAHSSGSATICWRCVYQWQIIDEPESGPEGTFVFSSDAVERLCRGLRLHRDLGINWEGVSVAMDLLDRIDHLEQHLQWLSGARTVTSEDEMK